jgi:hypothetical protein
MAGAGYKLFNTGDVLTAAQVNTYLNEQTVMVFADSAARTTALSGVLAEGMVSYLQDTNAVEVYNGSAWVGVSGAGDVTEVQAGVGISVASGTGPIPVITNSSTDLITTAGDLLYGTAADTVARLGIGTAAQVLQVNSGATAPEWAAPAAPSYVGAQAALSASGQSISYTSGVETIISFNFENFDTDGFHSTVTNTSRMTIPTGKGGKYLFTGTLFLNTVPNYARLTLAKNGTFIREVLSYGGRIGSIANAGNIVTTAAAGDYFELAFQGDVATGTYTAYGTFTLSYLGA